ncbi:MAG: transmembrane sensor [Saprospiraceae bacterium]|jgi:transmembrane sensor
MDKYLQYELEDFAQDDSFIRWVKKSNAAAEKKWQAFLNKYPEKRGTLEQAKLLVLSMQFDNAADLKTKENEIWSKVSAKTKAQATIIPRKTPILRYLVPIAAAAAIALVIFFNLPQTQSFDTLVKTEQALSKNITLPDGSVVALNSESQIEYDKENWEKNRRIQLIGEAFFKVQKGAKFTVETENGDVVVLGTSFNVFSRNESLQVVCETGKVAVRTDIKETILTPNQGVLVGDNKHILVEGDNVALNRSAWQKGIYAYDATPLSSVFSDMERQFGMKITTDNNIVETLFTGSFTAKEAEKAFYEICWPLGLKYTISEGEVFISK